MTAVIGVHCTSQYAFAAVSDGGKVIDREPHRLELPALETSDRIKVFVGNPTRTCLIQRSHDNG